MRAGLRVAPRPSVRAATRLPLRAAVLGERGGRGAGRRDARERAPVRLGRVDGGGRRVGARGGVRARRAARPSGRRGSRPGSPPAGCPRRRAGGWRGCALDDHPVAAAVAVRRAVGALDVPLVVVLGGPRCDVIEGLIDEQDLVLVVAARARRAARAARRGQLRRRRCRPRRRARPGRLAGSRSRVSPARTASPVPARDLVRGCRRRSRPGDRRVATRERARRGQASILLVGGLAGVLVGALVLGAVSRAVGREGAAQRAADLAALAGARAMHEAYPRLFEPAVLDGRPNPRHLDRAAYLELGPGGGAGDCGARTARRPTRRLPGRRDVRARPDPRDGPRARGGRSRAGAAGRAGRRPRDRRAVAARPGSRCRPAAATTARCELRQGKPMRPDVAQAFDRMQRAARADGVALLITSAYRSDAEQAVLWRRHPDPRWVARPGESLHRYGTELDLGPPAAYAWLAANAGAFHFVQRYDREPWHFGFVLNARSAPRPAARRSRRRPRRARAARASCPRASRRRSPAPRSAGTCRRRCSRRSCTRRATSTRSPSAAAGAQGIAQFMPETARAMGLADPFDAGAAIDAQARLMRDLLRRFAAVPLALAAYNAGPGAGRRLRLRAALPGDARLRRADPRAAGRHGGARPERTWW